MKYLFICLCLLAGFAFSAKDRTTLSKAYARDSSTTVTRFSVDQIVLNADSSLTIIANKGDVTIRLYEAGLPAQVRQGLQRINADLKAILER